MDSRLEDWRACGDDRHDRVRFRFIEALARRAEAHEGEARRLLDARLALLIEGYGAELEAAVRGAKQAAGTVAAAAREAGPADAAAPDTLCSLVEQLSTHGTDELKTLSYFRSTWSRLSADRRLTQSLAKVPDNAGPLNSHQLVHRSLTLMHELSPEYLNRFMAYVEALMWAERLEADTAPAPAAAARAEGQRKGGRRKAA
ncbi:DUF2894 domain-containing protein [Variovorax sp. J22P168]|uniref:DUF2894 domain-containing protein n=1 Tax=Variovorax jilinensis TaxID=3053513 RepID=UPI002576A55A|nr:DUF2894 domain-containing protein [Variovorax sp. J22P168]MDM0015639.1 DUF2894 domain-containing protein [Variovorax sp. J22P168]